MRGHGVGVVYGVGYGQWVRVTNVAWKGSAWTRVVTPRQLTSSRRAHSSASVAWRRDVTRLCETRIVGDSHVYLGHLTSGLIYLCDIQCQNENHHLIGGPGLGQQWDI